MSSDFFGEYDVLLAPSAQVVAFQHDQSELLSRTLSVNSADTPYLLLDAWPALASYGGLPATTMPVGLSSSGLPVGVQIIGPAGEDFTPLAFAMEVEALIGGFQPPPLD